MNMMKNLTKTLPSRTRLQSRVDSKLRKFLAKIVYFDETYRGTVRRKRQFAAKIYQFRTTSLAQVTLRRDWLQVLSLIGCFLVFPFIAQADTVLRTGEFVTIGSDQVVEDDFYGLAGSITHSGEIRGDMYVVGGSITQNGLVGSDLGVLGGTVQIHAPVSDDVRVIGGEVVIGEYVGGDVFVIGGVLRLLSSATVAGDVFFYGGEGQIEGIISGSVMGASERLRIDGTVAGGVDVAAQSLTLGDRTKISGDVRYISPNELVRSQNAIVEGELVRNQRQAEAASIGTELVTVLLVWLFAVLCLFLFFRREIEVMVERIKSEPAKVGLLGLATLLLTPIIFVLLMVTVLGALVGVVSLLAWLLAVAVALVLTAIVIGSYTLTPLKQPAKLNLLAVFVGAAVLVVLSIIPIVGPFVVFVAFTMTLGGLIYSLYKALRV